jgi:hypothetical protein
VPWRILHVKPPPICEGNSGSENSIPQLHPADNPFSKTSLRHFRRAASVHSCFTEVANGLALFEAQEDFIMLTCMRLI